MKAEHRKELQTNTLAAGMGRFVQQMKKKPERRTVLWVVLVGIVVIALVAWWKINSNIKERDSQLWEYLDRGSDAAMESLKKEYPNSNPGLAARFQYAYLLLWNDGIKRLPQQIRKSEGVSPVRVIGYAKQYYEMLAEEVGEDPIWGAEAAYNIAVAQESLAARDPKDIKQADEMDKDLTRALDDAVRLYRRVEEKFPNTARAEDAAKRRRQLENKESRQQIEDFYSDLSFPLRRVFQRFQQQHPQHPPLPIFPDKKGAPAPGGAS
jgi:hypothetical protein